MQEINNARQESSVRGVAIEQLQERIQQCVSAGIGTTACRWCGEPIHPEEIRMYPHERGIRIRHAGRQWVYLHCPKCGYDWALWKLQMKLDADRERPSCR